ncbi:MAG TPA: hypothetical protein VE934_06225 [Polaromonas sp.]|uniref:hypothetical protein n=1 Tax=Polaromonas sp. TaxID=1869339 RepID=UPI002D43A188|nr:hypothetical protein [Polaromonas sp.]HYW56534.1 hypothetical protein [Polaromonas sp.]
MKSTHHLVRVTSLAIGLALLMVTGTAAMISTFSAPHQRAEHASLMTRVGNSAEVATHSAGDDTLLYQRVIRSDGSAHWALVEEASTTLALRANTDIASDSPVALSTLGIHRVNYMLTAKPGGLNKAVKNCGAGSQTRSSAAGVYDILCNTMS